MVLYDEPFKRERSSVVGRLVVVVLPVVMCRVVWCRFTMDDDDDEVCVCVCVLGTMDVVVVCHTIIFDSRMFRVRG